jgi:hypothetical protein
MPSGNTFSIKPIGQFVAGHIGEGLWIDPFANSNKFAQVTNDLDPQYGTTHNLDALEFLKMFDTDSVDGVLFDPPYSPRQVSECYKSFGMTVTTKTTQASYWSNLKAEIGRIVKKNGKVLTFSWNSGGVGKKYGFEITDILLVAHGGWHNDTICVAEVRK